MQVFVLYYGEYYDSGRVLGVFASAEAAMASDMVEALGGGILEVWEQHKDGNFVARLCTPVSDDLEEPEAFAEYRVLPFVVEHAK